MADSTNPYQSTSASQADPPSGKNRPKGEAAYIITSLVLTVLWGSVTLINQLLYSIGFNPIESPTYFYFVIVFGWTVLALLGVTSLVHLYLWRLNFSATIVQIVVFTLMCYTIPFAIWAGVQLYLSVRHTAKQRLN